MTNRVFWVLICLCFATTATACPGCSYERMLNDSWHFKFYVSHVIIACLAAAHRLNVVRVLIVFLLLTIAECKAMVYLIYYSHPVTWATGAAEAWVYWGVWTLKFGIPGALVLFALGRFQFFRRTEAPAALWPIAAYATLVYGSNLMLNHY